MKTYKQLISEMTGSDNLVVNHKEIAKMHPDSKKAYDALYKTHRKAIESGQAGIHARLSKPDPVHGYHDLEITVHKFKKGRDDTSNVGGTQVAGSSNHESEFSIVHHKDMKYVKTKYGNHYVKK